MSMNDIRFEPKLTTIPEPPKKFGDDNGHFYRYYDALADELDEDMVKSLKAQLDGILIFAGLFAGVNSAFLALTLPAMSADPADDTNALLLQLVTGGNSTIRSAEDLPSAIFAPSPGIFPVNVLFSLSLTLALLSSFLAVLGQQWLVYYRKRSGGGAEYQRWEQLRRYLGAKRWRLEAILDDVLPGLLQLALVIFCIGFVAYLRTLSKTIYYVIMAPMMIAVAVLLLMGIVGAWDRWCPFKSPLSHLLQVLGNLIKSHGRLQYVLKPLLWVTYILISFALYMRRLASNMKIFLTHFLRNGAQHRSTILPPWKEVWGLVIRIVNQALNQALDRSGENIAQLEAVAAKRVICTSEDFNALIYTAINLHGMTSKESIQCFLGDETVYERLKELWEGGRRSAGSPKLLAGAFSRAFIQLIFMGESAGLLVEPRHRQRSSEALSSSGRDPTSLHPLRQNVEILDKCVYMALELGNDSIWPFYYCRVLKVILDETDRRSGLLEGCLNHIIAKYTAADDCKPHVICLVAWGLHMLNLGIATPMKTPTRRVSNQKWEFDRELELELERERELLELELLELERQLELELESEWQLELGRLGRRRLAPRQLMLRRRRRQAQLEGGRLEQLRGIIDDLRREIDRRRREIDPEHFIQVQQQRVMVVKELVCSVGWEKSLIPSRGSERPQDTVFGLIKEAFSRYNSQSPRSRGSIDVWLLEQALVIATKTSYFDGLNFIATSSVDLLCSLPKVEDTGAAYSWHGQDDYLRSTRILSRCLRAMKECPYTWERRQTIDSVAEQLEQHLPRFTADLKVSRFDTSALSIWLDIRETIEKPVDDWPQWIYPGLKAPFNAIESAMLKIKVGPKADGNSADPPPISAADGQAGPSGSPGTAATERVGEDAGEPEPAHRMQDDGSGRWRDEDASVDSPLEEGCGNDQEI